jgi:8-oxoguanine deaminase
MHPTGVLSFPARGVPAAGRLADIAVFRLSYPRYFGLHDARDGPVAGGAAAHLRLLMVGGVENGGSRRVRHRRG